MKNKNICFLCKNPTKIFKDTIYEMCYSCNNYVFDSYEDNMWFIYSKYTVYINTQSKYFYIHTQKNKHKTIQVKFNYFRHHQSEKLMFVEGINYPVSEEDIKNFLILI